MPIAKPEEHLIRFNFLDKTKIGDLDKLSRSIDKIKITTPPPVIIQTAVGAGPSFLDKTINTAVMTKMLAGGKTVKGPPKMRKFKIDGVNTNKMSRDFGVAMRREANKVDPMRIIRQNQRKIQTGPKKPVVSPGSQPSPTQPLGLPPRRPTGPTTPVGPKIPKPRQNTEKWKDTFRVEPGGVPIRKKAEEFRKRVEQRKSQERLPVGDQEARDVDLYMREYNNKEILKKKLEHDARKGGSQ